MEAYHVPSVHMQTISRQKRVNNPPIPSAGGFCAKSNSAAQSFSR